MREFELLQHVFETNRSLGDHIEIAPGDDMAMVRLRGRLRRGGEATARVLAAVDQVVEGMHFHFGPTITDEMLRAVGRKAVNRSISDIAAMASYPLASLACVLLPERMSENQANLFFDIMRETAQAQRCPLIGGDVSIGGNVLVCSVTVLAEPGPQGALTRGAAKPGHKVYVTGLLGGAWREREGIAPAVLHHLTFEPRVELALALATQVDRIGAMIDISDGLGRDAGHIAQQSEVSIRLDRAAIPCSEGCGWREALGDGEDYELCFTIPADVHVPEEVSGIRVTCIGTVHAMDDAHAPGVLIQDESGQWVAADQSGWEHRNDRAKR